MSRRRGREEVEEEEKEEEEEEQLGVEEQQQVNKELLEACWAGSVVDVRRALRKGAHINAASAHAQTGLILACWRKD
jgi:hypothetical protein